MIHRSKALAVHPYTHPQDPDLFINASGKLEAMKNASKNRKTLILY
jgi:hypothetical protein